MKTKRVITWAVANALFSLALWTGFVDGVAGARHVVVFVIWLMLVGSLLALHKGFAEKLRDDGPAVPMVVDGIFDACVVAFLVWHAEIVLGIACTVQSVILHAAFALPKNKASA